MKKLKLTFYRIINPLRKKKTHSLTRANKYQMDTESIPMCAAWNTEIEDEIDAKIAKLQQEIKNLEEPDPETLALQAELDAKKKQLAMLNIKIKNDDEQLKVIRRRLRNFKRHCREKAQKRRKALMQSSA